MRKEQYLSYNFILYVEEFKYGYRNVSQIVNYGQKMMQLLGKDLIRRPKGIKIKTDEKLLISKYV